MLDFVRFQLGGGIVHKYQTFFKFIVKRVFSRLGNGLTSFAHVTFVHDTFARGHLRMRHLRIDIRTVSFALLGVLLGYALRAKNILGVFVC